MSESGSDGKRKSSIERGLVHACILAVALFFFSDNRADVDLWGNAGFVKAPPWSEAFLRVNTYSFTEPNHPWVNHEWLSEWVLHSLLATMGNPGLLAYKVILGFVLLWLMHRAMRRDGCSGPLRFFWLLLTLSTLGYGMGIRPHVGTFVLTLLTLEWIRSGLHLKRRGLAIFALLGCFWANWHGAFFIGAILLFLDTMVHVSARPLSGTKASLGACVTFALGTLLNPHGYKLWDFVGASAGIFRPYLSEWAPLGWDTLSLHTDFLAMVLFLGVAIWKRGERRRFDLVVLGVSLFAAVAMRRNIPLFAIIAGLLGGRYLEAWVGTPLAALMSRFSPLLRHGVLVTATGVALWAALTYRKAVPFEVEVDAKRFPVHAMDFIEGNKLDGNALIFFDWAEQFIWHRYPGSRVFIDGRFCSAYSRPVMDDYHALVYDLNGWERALTNYPTDMVLLHRENPGVVRMRGLNDWRQVYHDELCVLFLKSAVHGEEPMVWPKPASVQEGWKRGMGRALFP